MNLLFLAPLVAILVVTIVVYRLMGEYTNVKGVLLLFLLTSATFFSFVALSSAAEVTDAEQPWVVWAEYSAIIVLSVRCIRLTLMHQKREKLHYNS